MCKWAALFSEAMTSLGVACRYDFVFYTSPICVLALCIFTDQHKTFIIIIIKIMWPDGLGEIKI